MTAYAGQNTASELVEDEFSWRLKEIVDLDQALRAQRKTLSERVLVRAAVTLLYAHWEGFIKAATEILILHVAEQRLTHKELRPSFWLFTVRGSLKTLAETEDAATGEAALQRILSAADQVTRFTAASAVSTESNLSSSVLKKIATSVAIDPEPYLTHAKLIDEALVKSRNNIAHGEGLVVSPERYDSLRTEIVGLLRCYKNDVQNMIALKTYRVPEPTKLVRKGV